MRAPEEFEAYFDREVASQLTDDYFRITLPANLNSNEATGPYWYGFVAAQIVLGAKSFLSTVPLSQILALGASGSKKQADKHHIFPDNYLKQHGQLTKRSNKGNFAILDYSNNIGISDRSPSSMPRSIARHSARRRMPRTAGSTHFPTAGRTWTTRNSSKSGGGSWRSWQRTRLKDCEQAKGRLFRG